MNPAEMFVLIVAIVMISSIFKSRYRSLNRGRDGFLDATATPDAGETRQLRDEVMRLKERIQTLERIAVEKENSLDREIEQLRDR